METDLQTTNRRQKERNTHVHKGKQQNCRQNRSPSLVIKAANPGDDTPEQLKARDHWDKSFIKSVLKCGYRTPRKDN
jgi:hypothetical protein